MDVDANDVVSHHVTASNNPPVYCTYIARDIVEQTRSLHVLYGVLRTYLLVNNAMSE